MKIGATEGTTTAVRSEVVATSTATRVTPGDGPTFGEVMRGGAHSLLRGAAAAVRSLPMGPVVAASVRPMGSTGGVAGTMGPAGSFHASAEAGQSADLSVSGGGATAPGTGGVEAALASSQEMNLYFLQLQEQIASENRAYTAYSNVLKARHETVKNAIGNIR